jgi:hypothetical protein
VKQLTGFYPRACVDARGAGLVSQAGGALLVETVRASGLDVALSQALSPWRKPLAVHDPAKVITDLAVALALGGDCLADIAILREQPRMFGRVASDPTVSRTIDALAADAPAALAAINTARALTRAHVWALAGDRSPEHETTAAKPVVIDLDATLITAHSEKENAAPTYKRGFGFHPLLSFADHGQDGTGEPLSGLLRKGNAGSNTAADHIAVTREALRQLPSQQQAVPGTRPGRKVLVRADGAGGTHEFLDWLVGQRLSYSVGFTLPTDFETTLKKIPKHAWTQAYDADGQVREGVFVAEVTDLLDLTSWPQRVRQDMRVIIRKERPHPGAQLRITDIDGNRITAFATNTKPGGQGTQLPDLELRHRRRARCEDRIRVGKDTGLRNLPLHDFTQNQIWLAIVILACEITAWMQMLALHGHEARRWEPKRLRLRLFSIAGHIARTGRRTHLHVSTTAPWAELLITAITRLRTTPASG